MHHQDAGPASGPLLSPRQVDAVLGFLGYGNPAGKYWFVGIEERGVGDATTLWGELLVRANHFAPVEDLKRAQEHPAFATTFHVGQYVPTWLTMSKIVLRLEGDPDWQDYPRAQRYQGERLGRHDGETFLADVFPLPAGNVDDWPYPTLFPSKDVYRARVLPARVAALRRLLDEHPPRYVFCYGKGHWADYRKLFADIPEYAGVGDGFAQVGRTPSGTLVALTPFFRFDRMGHARLDELATRLREYRFSWHDDDVAIEPAHADQSE